MAKIKIIAKPSAKKTYSYKADEKLQERASKVAKKKKTTLSALISEFVDQIAKG